MALQVTSPPRITTSALYNAPAFRNFFQQISDPWRSVTKKIFTVGIFRPPGEPAQASGCVARNLGLVAHLLGELVPPDPVPHLRPELPLHPLRHLVAEGPKAPCLLRRVELPAPGQPLA